VIPLPSLLRLVFAAVLWGGTFVAGRELAGWMEPLAAAWLRFVCASVVLVAWLLIERRAFPPLTGRQALGVLLLGLTGVFAYNLLFFYGLQTVEAGRAALIVAMNPVVIALASAGFFGERLAPRQAFGVVLSLVGAVVVIGRGDLAGLLHHGIGRGEWLLLGCVASWVAYTLVGKRLLAHLSPLVAVTYASLAGTLLFSAVVVGRGGIELAPLAHPAVWLNIGYLALFGTVLAFVWYYRGVQAVGAARAAQFINLVPVSGVLLGAILLDEPLSASLLAGGALVIVGLVLTNRWSAVH